MFSFLFVWKNRTKGKKAQGRRRRRLERKIFSQKGNCVCYVNYDFKKTILFFFFLFLFNHIRNVISYPRDYFTRNAVKRDILERFFHKLQFELLDKWNYLALYFRVSVQFKVNLKTVPLTVEKCAFKGRKWGHAARESFAGAVQLSPPKFNCKVIVQKWRFMERAFLVDIPTMDLKQRCPRELSVNTISSLFEEKKKKKREAERERKRRSTSVCRVLL